MQSRIVNQTGSSPLTRGKPAVSLLEGLNRGLIPAHAGKTLLRRGRVHVGRAHPRSRGENLVRHVEPVRRLGSSPLTRGKPTLSWTPGWVKRLIPAHAGKTRRLRSYPGNQRAHPRSRGENRRTRTCVLSPLGSSPLTRGKPARGPPREVGAGLIPAHAGKTTSS